MARPEGMKGNRMYSQTENKKNEKHKTPHHTPLIKKNGDERRFRTAGQGPAGAGPVLVPDYDHRVGRRSSVVDSVPESRDRDRHAKVRPGC